MSSHTHSVYDSISDFDGVFLEIPVKNCIAGMLLTCPFGHNNSHEDRTLDEDYQTKPTTTAYRHLINFIMLWRIWQKSDDIKPESKVNYLSKNCDQVKGHSKNYSSYDLLIFIAFIYFYIYCFTHRVLFWTAKEDGTLMSLVTLTYISTLITKRE